VSVARTRKITARTLTFRGLAALALAFVACSAARAATAPVRALTAFIDLDAQHYAQQFAEASARLKIAQARFEAAGFTVQTVRITTQPFMRYVGALSHEQALVLLTHLDELGRQEKVAINIGPAALDDQPDPRALALLEEVQAQGLQLNASMIIADEAGIHWNTIRAAAHHVARVAARSAHSQGTFAFAATAMLAPGSPFFPGSYHTGQAGRFAVGLQSAGTVAEVFARTHGDAPAAIRALADALSGYARTIQQLAPDIEARTGWSFWGFDPTPAPLKEDSIGTALEAFHPATLGSPGSMTAAYVITEAERQVPGPRVGYSGLMLPVLEDSRIAQRWGEGAVNLDSLLAYSAVCGTGLDTVPLPGDVTEAQLARIMGDVAVLAYKWKKPLTARLQPVHGRKAGEMTEFDSPFMVNARIQALK
jgi:uncharacterized protein (UPF0210 family)